MSNEDGTTSLTAALKLTLDRDGTLDSIRAQLRSTILHCMNESLPTADDPSHSRPPEPIENVLINEVIAEYLASNGYDRTLSVFVAESRTPTPDGATGAGAPPGADGVRTLGEAFIRAELGLAAAAPSSAVSLLHDIVQAAKVRRPR